jgi:hypothetical protein
MKLFLSLSRRDMKFNNIPRIARIDAHGAIHHVICRGIEHKKIFRDNPYRKSFVDRLVRILKELGLLLGCSGVGTCRYNGR